MIVIPEEKEITEASPTVILSFWLQSFKKKKSQFTQWESKQITPSGPAVKNPPTTQDSWVQLPGQEDPQSSKWQLTQALLPGKSHGQRRLQAIVHGVAKN